MTHTKLLIIGGGPAGYTAAIYAARAELQPIVLTGPEPGGQLMQTTEVENFPGFAKGIIGPELMQNMRDQAARFGAVMHDVAVTKVDLQAIPKKIWAGADEFTAETVIIATGASALWLGLPNEQRLRGKGVSACATCDGFFFKGKEVAVVGGGDAAMEEATFLTKFATHVHVLVRGAELRASKAMVRRAEADPKITIHYSVSVGDVLGDQSVTGLSLKHADGQPDETLAVQGLFLAIGHKPNTSIFQEQLSVDHKGYLQVHDQVLTSIDGVFVAGDVSDYRYRQAITAAGWGCMAALEAEKFLSHRA
jgi:thioredoxin reductase (NADPH)